jgi:hypothetical protein
VNQRGVLEKYGRPFALHIGASHASSSAWTMGN